MDVANDSYHKSFNDESWIKQIYDEKVMNTNAKYVFVYANIKRFQYMNDKYGRKIADEVVEVVYDVLKKHLRKDEYVARIYGDHFNLMVEYHNMEDVYKGFLSPFVDDIFE
ncbi:MAG: diguanylate cyclase [Bacilli bacterium]|nr:diguanylate cyclase [Bacilli bacterium]